VKKLEDRVGDVPQVSRVPVASTSSPGHYRVSICLAVFAGRFARGVAQRKFAKIRGSPPGFPCPRSVVAEHRQRDLRLC
jgi:hypothetical protein